MVKLIWLNFPPIHALLNNLFKQGHKYESFSEHYSFAKWHKHEKRKDLLHLALLQLLIFERIVSSSWFPIRHFQGH